MALNPNIILAGQPIDVLGSMARGNELAGQTMQLRDQNALRQVYQTQGAGLVNGDPNAINALAAIDPSAAIGLRNSNLDGQLTQRRMDILSAEEKRQIAEFNSKASAEERAQAAAKIEEAVRMGMAAQSPEQWDGLMRQMGADELVGQFGNKQMHVNKYLTMAEALKAAQGPEPLSPSDRYKVVGGSLFDLGADGGPQAVGQGAMPEETIMGPDGRPMIIRGGPGTAAKFTESQSKDNVYATRAEGAIAAFEPVADALASYVENAKEAVPFNLARGLQTDEFQKARQAGRELLAVILRKDTGAAVTAPEEKMYGEVFLPQPGDGKPVLEQKRIARARAVEALKSGMNADQIIAMGRALLATDARVGASQGAADFSRMGIPEIGQVDIMTLSPADLDALEARMKELGL